MRPRARRNLLLQTVLPGAAVQLVGHFTVFRTVGLEIGVKQIQVGTADGDLPDTGGQVAARKGDLRGHPLSFGIHDRFGRDVEEVLGIVTGFLVTLCGQHLGKVAIAVEQTDGDEVDVHVGRLLQVVAGQDAEAAGINLQGRIQAVFHAEIGDGRVGTLFFGRHVGVELIHDGFELGKESFVFCKFGVTLEADGIENDFRVVTGGMPDFGVDRFEKSLGTVVPAPPEVLRECLETGELRRKVACHHDTRPGGSINFDFFVLHGF